MFPASGMTLSTRLFIQWSDKKADENTSTMVSSSPKGHFVDIRIFLKSYPHIDKSQKVAINDVFDWCMTGTEVPIEATSKIRFDHEIDSHAVAKSIETARPVEEFQTDPDIGEFFSIENSLDRREIGSMVNPASGEVEDYTEHWRSLDAENHTPDSQAQELANSPTPKVAVLTTSSDSFDGKFIILGNWAQGMFHDKSKDSPSLRVFRAHFHKDSGIWKPLIEYGDSSVFPLAFSGTVGDEFVAEKAIKWICLEV